MQGCWHNSADWPAGTLGRTRLFFRFHLKCQRRLTGFETAQQGAQGDQFFSRGLLGHGSSLSVRPVVTLPKES